MIGQRKSGEMEKYGVELEKKKETEKEGADEEVCPKCGVPLIKEANVPICPACGVRPFEKEDENVH